MTGAPSRMAARVCAASGSGSYASHWIFTTLPCVSSSWLRSRVSKSWSLRWTSYAWSSSSHRSWQDSGSSPAASRGTCRSRWRRRWSPSGGDAEYVRIEGHGKNALAFHIAYYIGRLAEECPGAFFLIISRDTGFEALIRQLKSKKIFCLRWASIEAMPLVRLLHSRSLPDRVNAGVESLTRRNSGRPRTLNTLGSAIRTLFQDDLSDEELESILGRLRKRGVVADQGGKVEYALPESTGQPGFRRSAVVTRKVRERVENGAFATETAWRQPGVPSPIMTINNGHNREPT